MKYRYLGTTGLKISAFCLGAMNFGPRTSEKEAISIINAAISNGINMINTADIDYSGRSEEVVGKALKQHGERHKIIWSAEVAGKDMGVPYEPKLHKTAIFDACHRSLKRFNTDYIDLLNIPRPNTQIPIIETLEALSSLVQQGKVRYIGTSTFPAWQVLEALTTGEKRNLCRISTELSPYNLLDRRIENELVPFALKYNVGILAWAPLAQGVLAGRYTKLSSLPDDSRAAQLGGIYKERVTKNGILIGNEIAKLAARSKRTPAQFSYLWVRDQPGIVAPVVGVRTLSQLEDIIKVFDDSLNEEERKLCDSLNPPGSVVTDFFNSAPWMQMQVAGS